MIQPDKLRRYNVAEIPPSVFHAWEAHKAFVKASSFAAESIGIRFLEGVKPDTITLGFFRSMLENKGTNHDVDWLIGEHLLDKEDESLWPLAVGEYATRDFS